jgi:CheY-like chemotaxis protein
MNITGPIIFIDDDHDDQEVFTDALHSLGIADSLIRLFDNCNSALEYLEATSEKPFIIICDINLPVMNGLQFRQKINEDDHLRRKSIPFVFLSTAAERSQVVKAYDLTVQGFFIKPITFTAMQDSFKLIIDYWKDCIHPNSVK